MGSGLSKESMSVEQLQVYLEDLKSRDVCVTVIVSACHYEKYAVTETHNEIVPRTEADGDTFGHKIVPVSRRRMKQRKVETYRQEHILPLQLSSDLTGPVLLPLLTKEHPILNVKMNLDVFPLDGRSSEILDQFKMRLADQFQNRDKIIETEIQYSVGGHKTLTAGKRLKLHVYNPEFEDEANSGSCCFGPSEKTIKISIIKKFTAAPLHYAVNQVVPITPSSYAPPPQFYPPPPASYPAPPASYPAPYQGGPSIQELSAYTLFPSGHAPPPQPPYNAAPEAPYNVGPTSHFPPPQAPYNAGPTAPAPAYPGYY
eukprot:GFUD01060511.1.p1 GENE.GFUD01060511.1~~GFUD01060511.1.p1  ORF type:complete len:314 (-),score=94.07 GFUD01060511.1:150-1091(-)